MGRDALEIGLGNGVEFSGEPRCYFDPAAVGNAGIYCVSHAHEDHLPKSVQGKKVVCSDATLRCAISRLGCDLEIDEPSGIEMKNAGHVAGSTMFLVNGDRKVLYTGDFCPRNRLGIVGAAPSKADVLVIEATYGMPRYVFPPTDAMIGVIKDWVDDNISQGQSVALFAYPLGKSQELIRMLGSLTPYLHGSVMNMTCLVEGTETLSKCLPYSRENVKEPFLMICPPSVRNSNLIRHWKKKGMRIAIVSGWSVESSFKYKMGVDEAFPFSDHADFEELMAFVRACSPSVVFTHHGFSVELASEIQRSFGIEAHPLIRNQKSLLEF